mmetsp:Transcript_139605/g.348153  ORF Transcript_139605/g.348153 Transcript_139605/m.348153 type:complete len:407 (-) Transcript_139605:63-1283(-)
MGNIFDTALGCAIGSGNSAEVRTLIEGRASVNEPCHGGFLPLQYALHMRHLEVARILIECRADINAQNLSSGRLPAHIAAEQGDTAALALLLDARANVEQRRKGSRRKGSLLSGYAFGYAAETPFDSAIRCSHPTVAALIAVKRPFSATNFKREYDALAPSSGSFQISVPDLLTEVDGVIQQFASCNPWLPISHDKARDFSKRLRASSLKPGEDATQLVERLWTSLATCEGGFEFCHMLNFLLSTDNVVHAVKVVRALNTCCVTGSGRGPNASPVQWPVNNESYRAAGMPAEHRAFFQPGVKYRAPRAVPTSFDYDANFAFRQNHEPIKWIMKMDASRKCHHVNYITRRADGVKDEREFLFAPYSVFTVLSVHWSSAPWTNPHEIELQVPVDNRNELDTLPLAPWC